MLRVRNIPVQLSEPVESTRQLSQRIDPINHRAVSGRTVKCSVCGLSGRINAKLVVRGERFVCGGCK